VNVVVEELNVKAENLSTAQNHPPGQASLALRLGTGTVTMEGAVSVAPVVADLRLAVKEIDIRPFQSYLTEKVKVTITDGRVSTTGRLELSIKEPEGLSAKFTGETTLARFSAIEKANAEDILNCQSLALSELSVGVNPLFVRAKKVALSDFFRPCHPAARRTPEPAGARRNGGAGETRGHVEGRADFAAERSGGAARRGGRRPGPAQGHHDRGDRPAGRSRPVPGSVGEAGLQRDDDRDRRPGLRPHLHRIEPGGSRTARPDEQLRSAGGHRQGPPAAQGSVRGYPGAIHRNGSEPDDALLRKVRRLFHREGQLSFDLAYHIDKGKLNSENKVFVDQFTFGDKVDSPDATSLPVKLAVALLKDRNGRFTWTFP